MRMAMIRWNFIEKFSYPTFGWHSCGSGNGANGHVAGLDLQFINDHWAEILVQR